MSILVMVMVMGLGDGHGGDGDGGSQYHLAFRFKMEVEGELTNEHPKYFDKVKVDYHFYGNDLNEKKFRKAVDLSAEKYCGVMEMFRHFADIQTEIHFHDS